LGCPPRWVLNCTLGITVRVYSCLGPHSFALPLLVGGKEIGRAGMALSTTGRKGKRKQQWRNRDFRVSRSVPALPFLTVDLGKVLTQSWPLVSELGFESTPLNSIWCCI
jgi:hypothetical protein